MNMGEPKHRYDLSHIVHTNIVSKIIHVGNTHKKASVCNKIMCTLSTMIVTYKDLSNVCMALNVWDPTGGTGKYPETLQRSAHLHNPRLLWVRLPEGGVREGA